MQLSKWIKGMMFITVMSLIYINLQMKIYDLPYQAKKKEHQIQKLRDDNGVATYHILALKSVSHIGQKLLDEQTQMQFVGNDKVYELAASQKNVKEISKSPKGAIGSLSLNVQNLLTFSTAQAEARSLDKY